MGRQHGHTVRLACARSHAASLAERLSPPQLDAMSATLRLLSPELITPITMTVEPTWTIAQVKEKALADWPTGAPVLQAPVDAAAPALTAASTTCAGLSKPAPVMAQLRIIHQGRFLTDEKALKGERSALCVSPPRTRRVRGCTRARARRIL